MRSPLPWRAQQERTRRLLAWYVFLANAAIALLGRVMTALLEDMRR
jgi:hypothetical protein